LYRRSSLLPPEARAKARFGVQAKSKAETQKKKAASPAEEPPSDKKCTYLSHSYLLRSTCAHLHMQEVKPPFPRGSCSNDCKKRPASCIQKKPAAAAPPPGPVRQAKTRTTGGRTPAAPLEGVAQGQQQDRACAAPRAKKPAPSSNNQARAWGQFSERVGILAYSGHAHQPTTSKPASRMRKQPRTTS
jgi:hypothetical protein